MTILYRPRFDVFTRRRLVTGAGAFILARPAIAEGENTLKRADGATTPALFVGQRAAGAPVAVLSHGLGADGSALRWLAEALAARGFFCVLPTHAESSRSALRDAFFKAVLGEGLRRSIAAKVADAALENARSLDIAASLAAADPDRRAPFRVLIGHSMGAAATLIEAGAETRFGRIGRDAFDAYVAISPDGPGSLFLPDAWRDIRKPALIVTGTRDGGTEGDWRWRASVFDRLPPGGKRIGVIPMAGHLQLGGLSGPRIRDVVVALTEEFIDQARARRFSPSRVAGADIREK